MKYEQMSIYDFLQNGESQEVQPSETVPQVDEAQEVNAPSSDLDASIPTEDTDNVVTNSTLFSVGDTVKVRSPFDVTTPEEDPETWFYMDKFQKVPLEIVGHEGKALECKAPNGETILFYRDELYKIN
ncbi:hypothetical protein BC6_00026 [Bacillus phage BC-6]|nr:hypothetical protein BC6_00026 [Bacillus phage BC-6]